MTNRPWVGPFLLDAHLPERRHLVMFAEAIQPIVGLDSDTLAMLRSPERELWKVALRRVAARVRDLRIEARGEREDHHNAIIERCVADIRYICNSDPDAYQRVRRAFRVAQTLQD